MTARRRPLRGWHERVASVQESFNPGSLGGRVSSVGPLVSSDAVALDEGAVGTVGNGDGTEWFEDTFALAADGAQDFTLTFLPVDFSEIVTLRELKRRRDVDWSRTDQTLSLLAACSPRAGDELVCQYEYLTGTPLVPEEPLELNVPYVSPGWKYHTLTDAALLSSYVDPAFDDSAWPEGTTPIGLAGFVDIEGHAVQTVVPAESTGQPGHEMDVVLRRLLPAGTGIAVSVDESTSCNVYVDGVLLTGSNTGNPVEFSGPVADQAADWLLAVHLTVGNGASTGGVDIQVTGTET